LCTAEQADRLADRAGSQVMIVATPVVWVLLRVQVTGPNGVEEADLLRKSFEICPSGGRAEVDRVRQVDSELVESSWEEFSTALDTVISLAGVPAREEGLVARYRVLGIGASSSPPNAEFAPAAQR